MRRMIDVIFDLLGFMIMITCCLPIFVKCYSYLVYKQSFGFNTLVEKSVVATDYQMRDVEKLGYFSKIQALLAPAVDDIDTSTRTVLVDGEAYVYSLDDLITSRGKALEELFSQHGFNVATDVLKNYKLKIDTDGSLIFYPKEN